MKNYSKFMRNLPVAADLPCETILCQPIVEIYGYDRVLIERHSGVTEYGRNCIHVKVSFGYIEICGADLQLAGMSKEQLVITGKIIGVTLRRG